MTTLKVEVVTPERALWVGEARALVARSTEGWFTILPQHTATVGDLVAGILRVDTVAGEITFAVHGGYFQVGPDETEGVTLATVLAGVAEITTEIDLTRAQVAREAAQAAVAATQGRPDDLVSNLAAQSALERAELRLRAVAK